MKVEIDLYAYKDYREYLRDYHLKRKSVDSKYSHRYFAMKAGYNSSGLYSNIVKGINNLTPKYLPKFIKGLALEGRDAEFFTLMVEHTHAPNSIERQRIWEQMIQLMPVKLERIKQNQTAFYSKWYHVAVFNGLDVLDFEEEYEDLAAFLNPPIKKTEAKHSVQLLQSLGLISKNEDGFWKPNGNRIVGGEEVGVQRIRDFQGELMDLAKEAQGRFVPSERYIVSKSLTASREGILRLRKAVQELFSSMNTVVLADEEPEQVFQLNLQFFPMSERKEVAEERFVVCN